MDGVDAKLRRAREHIAEVEHVVTEYWSMDPYGVDVEDDHAASERRLVIRVRHEPPPTLGLIAGDVVHNARAALDHLACQLVEQNGAVVTRSTCFPITEREGGWGDVAGKALKGLSPGQRATVKNLKPWRGGAEDLWRLHQLDVLDKHRLLMVVLTRYAGIIIGGGQWRPFADDPEAVVDVPEIALNAADKEPVHDGYVGYTQPLDIEPGPLAGSERMPKVRIELALWPEDGAEGQPLVPLLDRVVTAAEHAVAHVRSGCDLT